MIEIVYITRLEPLGGQHIRAMCQRRAVKDIAATLGKEEQGNPLIYAGFAFPCKPLQLLPDHS
jgi:hypothetical protein